MQPVVVDVWKKNLLFYRSSFSQYQSNSTLVTMKLSLTLLVSAAATISSASAFAAKKAPTKKPVLKKAVAKKPVAATKKPVAAKKVIKKKVVAKKGGKFSGGSAVASFEEDIGATLPLGFFDPLGLVADGDQVNFDRLRLTELKHGRISMLAVVGYLVQEAGFRWPGSIDLAGDKFEDIPNGYAAIEAIPYGGKLQLFALIGALEVFVMRDFTGGEFPGDLRNDYIDFGWDTFDEPTKLRKRSIELAQGRAAMMGILALMVHEQLGVSLIPSAVESQYAF
jgi:hypothetical protein